jgi:hypothetical protein
MITTKKLPYGSVREGATRVLKAIAGHCETQKRIHGLGALECSKRGELALEIAAIYEAEINTGKLDANGLPMIKSDYLSSPLEAATDQDTLGTLAATVVAQRCLDVFRYQFPLLGRILTDLSEEPGELNQASTTRKILTPTVQSYDNTLDADGRPKGWATASAGSTVDLPITMDELVGVPIPFSMATLSSTQRKLFMEVAPAASYALVKYWVIKILGVCTAANYNAYAAVTAADAQGLVKVPTAYPTFACGLVDFSRTKMVEIGTAFDANEVPEEDRTLLLNSQYYAKGTVDPSLVNFFAGQQAPGIITQGVLPHLNNFALLKAPYFPGSNNRVGMALQRNGLLAKSRLPAALDSVLPGGAKGAGTYTQVVDAQTGMAMLVIEYSDPRRGFAEWLPCVIIGAAKGDTRGGLVMTAQ